MKRKGKFCYGVDLAFHQNHSSQIIAIAAENFLTCDKPIDIFIRSHRVLQDFLIMTKVPKSSILKHGTNIIPNVIRFVVSTDGEYLLKVMPAAGPIGTFKRANSLTDEYYNQVKNEVGDNWDERINTKNKSVYEDRQIGIQTGNKTTLCNDLHDLNNANIDYDYYIQQTIKLTRFD